MSTDSRLYRRLFIIISVLIPAIVGVLLFMPKPDPTQIRGWIYQLPLYNAVINTLTAVLLVLGFYFVKNRKLSYHKVSMLSAFALGTLFLIFYVVYHSNAPSTRFGGEGAIRYMYFFFLISHILLAFLVVPLVLAAIYFALSENFEKHKRIVKYTFPVWLYVSITGVIVYVMISPYYPY